MKQIIFRRVRFFMLLLLPIFVFGCSSAPQGKLVSEKSFLLVETPPGLKISMLKKEGSLAKYCAPREADFAFTGSQGFEVGMQVPLSGADDAIGDSATNGALSLGGRDPEVLILREAFYRACELSLNFNYSGEEAVRLYLSFLQTISPMLATQGNQAGSGVVGMNGTQVTLPSLGVSPPPQADLKPNETNKVAPTCSWKNTSTLKTCMEGDTSCGDYLDENRKTCKHG